jgi:eukaryotic-like serine/threonine-protein kinase
VETAPAAGQVALHGSEVTVVVSLGPELAPVTVPDVRGLSVGRARTRLESLGLRAEVETSCAAGTTVAETEPLAGTAVREGDLVALFVC